MSAQDILIILGGISALAVVVGGQIVLIVNAVNRRADEASAERQAIAQPQVIANAVAATPPPAEK